jgi:hypothetical protein
MRRSTGGDDVTLRSAFEEEHGRAGPGGIGKGAECRGAGGGEACEEGVEA